MNSVSTKFYLLRQKDCTKAQSFKELFIYLIFTVLIDKGNFIALLYFTL